jgi:hypothetical protein
MTHLIHNLQPLPSAPDRRNHGFMPHDIVMLADIAMRQALAHGQSKPPKPPQAPRRKRARVYR